MPPDDIAANKALIDHRLQAIEKQLDNVLTAIEKLSIDMVRFEAVNKQVGKINERVEKHSKRLQALETSREADRRVLKFILRFTIGIGVTLVPIAIDAVRGLLGGP